MRVFQQIRWFFFSKDLNAQRARRVVKVVSLVGLFAFLLWLVPVDKIVQVLLTLDPPYFISGILVSFVAFFLSSLELTILVRKQKISLNIWQVFSIVLGAKFYGQFVQGNIVAGGYKWYRLAQPDKKSAEAFASLAFLRLLETFLTILFGVVFWLLSGQIKVGITGIWLGVAFIVSILFWLFLVRFSVPVFEWFKARTENLKVGQLGQAFLKYLKKFLSAVVVYADLSLVELTGVVVTGLVAMFVGVFSNLLLARSLAINISYLDLGWINAVVSLGSQIPIFPAGGLGLREATLVSLLPAFGVGADLALVFSFLLFIRGIINALVGGFVEAIRVLILRSAPPIPRSGENTTGS